MTYNHIKNGCRFIFAAFSGDLSPSPSCVGLPTALLIMPESLGQLGLERFDHRQSGFKCRPNAILLTQRQMIAPCWSRTETWDCDWDWDWDRDPQQRLCKETWAETLLKLKMSRDHLSDGHKNGAFKKQFGFWMKLKLKLCRCRLYCNLYQLWCVDGYFRGRVEEIFVGLCNSSQ